MSLRTLSIRTHLVLVLLAMAPPLPRVVGEVVAVPPTDEHALPGPMEVLVCGAWGSGPGQFGKLDEASRPGPMDFVVTDDTLYVLDPVNARVQLFDLDGVFRREVAIGTATADFMCVDDAGNVTVLDAFVRRELRTFSSAGVLLAHARIPQSIGLCSATWTEGERVWIEERHDRVYELSIPHDGRGASATVIATLGGRPVGRGRAPLHARKAGRRDVIVQGPTSTTLRFGVPVATIAALESDESGRIYLAVTCHSVSDDEPWTTDIVVVALTADGSIAGTVRMPNAYVTDHYRKVGVSPTGEIIQMQTSANGVRFVRWSLTVQTIRGAVR